jgi:alpha-D-ribose 1-methylphosphonate 5-triphosphate synthase subunit PhnG
MAIVARASRAQLEQALADLDRVPEFEWLRRPETGLVLTQGRAGGTGSPFNLGEVTMTRCALKLANGMTGFAFVMGRDEKQAELAALFDALLQGADDTAKAALQLVAGIERAQNGRREHESRKAASTKVNFFAMTHGPVPL